MRRHESISTKGLYLFYLLQINMDFGKSSSLVLLAIGLMHVFNLCQSLELRKVSEGPCSTAEVDSSFNLTWFVGSDWRYFAAGSRYALFTITVGHPGFAIIRDFEFYYDSCIEIRDMNFAEGSFSLNSFGGQAFSRNTNLQFVAPGVFDLNFAPGPRPGLGSQVVRHYITLTNNQNFIFMHNCLNGTERGFSVISTQPSLDAQTLRRIEQHAISLGHSRENVVFSRRETCSAGGGSTTPAPTPPTPTPVPTPPPKPSTRPPGPGMPWYWKATGNTWSGGRKSFFPG